MIFQLILVLGVYLNICEKFGKYLTRVYWEIVILKFYSQKNTVRNGNFKRFLVIFIQNTKKTLIVLYIFWTALVRPIWICIILEGRYCNYLINGLNIIFRWLYCLGFFCHIQPNIITKNMMFFIFRCTSTWPFRICITIWR